MRLLLGISTLLTRKLCTRRAARLGAAACEHGTEWGWWVAAYLAGKFRAS